MTGSQRARRPRLSMLLHPCCKSSWLHWLDWTAEDHWWECPVVLKCCDRMKFISWCCRRPSGFFEITHVHFCTSCFFFFCLCFFLTYKLVMFNWQKYNQINTFFHISCDKCYVWYICFASIRATDMLPLSKLKTCINAIKFHLTYTKLLQCQLGTLHIFLFADKIEKHSWFLDLFPNFEMFPPWNI